MVITVGASAEFLSQKPRNLSSFRVTNIESSVFFSGKKPIHFGPTFLLGTRKLIERLREEDAVASRQFADEASAFASANPRVDLGRETSSKVAVKSIETWEMIPERLSTIIWRCLKK